MDAQDSFKVEMGKRINERRKQLDLTQEELADKADISPQVLSTAIRGVKVLRSENIMKVSAALGVSADYLLTGDIVDKDAAFLYEKLKGLSGEQFRDIEKVIDLCLHLSGG